ncbi:hypothetical protein KQH82_03010 [bacterium]|nr:hypothetical protein [bacterium]
MNKGVMATALLTVVLVVLGMVAVADVPDIITYQGRLTDVAGEPINTPQNVQFNIYDSESGMVPVWSTLAVSLPVTNGLFTYELGKTVPFGHIFEDNSVLYLGITVGTDPEMTPRTRLTSVAYSNASGFAWDVADGIVTEDKLAMHAVTQEKIQDNSIHSAHIQNRSIGFDDIGYSQISSELIQDGTIDLDDIGQNGAADGQIMKWSSSASRWQLATDDIGSGGDITGVTAGSGLSGGGTSGTVTVAVATGGITSTHIANGAIADTDISGTASISTSKISGTAVNLSSVQTITANKTFDGTVYFGDSTLRVSNGGIVAGTTNTFPDLYLLNLRRRYQTAAARYGIYSAIENASTGAQTGVYASAIATTPGQGGEVYGLVAYGQSDNSLRYGIQCTGLSLTPNYPAGVSMGIRANAYYGQYTYGVFGYAADGFNEYGVYGTTGKSLGGFGVYSYGDLFATGTNTKGGGGYKIDHPDDPEHLYLSHSDVSSPEAKNVYDGVVELDGNGEATVELPRYFESLNESFRYQLTAIGVSMPNLYVARKISDNRFTIAGGEPFAEVSWLVTGIRRDAFAKATRTDVESAKQTDKQGRYLQPEAYGLGLERAVDFENHQAVDHDPEAESE